VTVPRWEHVLVLLFMGLVQLAVPLLFYMHGARSVATSHMVLVTMADAVLNPLWVWLAHGEEPVQAVYIGGALVWAAFALTTLRRGARGSRQRRPQSPTTSASAA
jgi:drug/metabolite transporter (DMT)-like permease